MTDTVKLLVFSFGYLVFGSTSCRLFDCGFGISNFGLEKDGLRGAGCGLRVANLRKIHFCSLSFHL